MSAGGHNIYKDRTLGSVPERTELMPCVEVVKDKRDKPEKWQPIQKRDVRDLPARLPRAVEHLTTSAATKVARD